MGEWARSEPSVSSNRKESEMLEVMLGCVNAMDGAVSISVATDIWPLGIVGGLVVIYCAGVHGKPMSGFDKSLTLLLSLACATLLGLVIGLPLEMGLIGLLTIVMLPCLLCLALFFRHLTGKRRESRFAGSRRQEARLAARSRRLRSAADDLDDADTVELHCEDLRTAPADADGQIVAPDEEIHPRRSA